MGTTKSRKSRRNNSRPTAYSFLSNISLGNENEKPPDETDIRTFHSEQQQNIFYIQEKDQIGVSSLHSSDSSFSDNEETTIQTTLPSNSQGRFNSSTTPIITTNTSVVIVHPTNNNALLQSIENNTTIKRGTNKYLLPKRNPSSESSSNDDVEHFKLTRQDSERPIASEKIKKKSAHGGGSGSGSGSNHTQQEHQQYQHNHHHHHGISIMSVFRYYTDKIRHSTSKRNKSFDSFPTNRGYVQQQLEGHDGQRHRKTQSYAHFLNTTGSLLDDETVEQSLTSNSYDPYFLDDEAYYGVKYNVLLDPSSSLGSTTLTRPSDVKRELNEQFRLQHTELAPEMTLSKLRAIKLHLLEIGKQVDLEVSSVAHAYVFFEKLVVKNMVTKRNRKLIAACCLFLATKVNEAKGTWFRPLLDAMDDELNVDSEEIHEHEFAVFADLEFNLYVPRREFMPHFERILNHLEYKSVQEYLGKSCFFEVTQRT